MLVDVFAKLKENRAIRLVRSFLRSPWYVALVALLTACSELFGLELPVFYAFTLFGLTIFLFDEDMLGIIAIIPCCYLAISAKNNPGKFAKTIFSDPSAIMQMTMLGLIFAVMFIARLISLLLLNRRRKPPELTIGFLLFSFALVFSGAFSGHWGKRTVLFAVTEIVAFSIVYFYFYFAVNWKNVPKHYAMTLFLAIGASMTIEMIGCYFLPGAVVDGVVHRGALYTGWGIYNNVGCVMVLCLPAPFYFAVKRKEGWIFSLLGIAFFLSVLLTQSRNAMILGTALFCVCCAVVLIKTKGWERWKSLIAYGAFALVMLITGLTLRERIAKLYDAIGDVGFDDALRFDTYRACWKRFLEAPWFGSGFYYTPGTVLQASTGMWTTMEGAGETGFIPPRAHNTLFQLLASGGIFLLLSYLFHRVQTGILFYRHPTTEKTIASLCVIGLLLTSLLDCHLFNFGPGLMYSALLVFAEGDNLRREKRSMYAPRDFKKLKDFIMRKKD